MSAVLAAIYDDWSKRKTAGELRLEQIEPDRFMLLVNGDGTWFTVHDVGESLLFQIFAVSELATNDVLDLLDALDKMRILPLADPGVFDLLDKLADPVLRLTRVATPATTATEDCTHD